MSCQIEIQNGAFKVNADVISDTSSQFLRNSRNCALTIMEEDSSEVLAQLQHENLKLKNELDQVKRHAVFLEENNNLLYSTSLQSQTQIESLEHQITSMWEALKEKEEALEIVEKYNENFSKANKQLISEKNYLKTALDTEKQILVRKEEEFSNTFIKIKEENRKLLLELNKKSEENFRNGLTINELIHTLKEMEDEKLIYLNDAKAKDHLLQQMREEMRKEQDVESTLIMNPEFGLFTTGSNSCPEELFSYNDRSPNLWQEILEVEIQEKQILIKQLEHLLMQKEEENKRFHNLLSDLRKKLEDAGLLSSDTQAGLRINPIYLVDIYQQLLRLIQWPAGQSEECKTLFEVKSFPAVKNDVEMSQPVSLRPVETTSIASQTEPFKTSSPMLPLKNLMKYQLTEVKSPSDSDEEGLPYSLLEEMEMERVRRICFERKNNDLDMDVFRSSRKLSVLPEEDPDELVRKNSLKNIRYFKRNDAKTRSADDIHQMKTVKFLMRETCSYVSISRNLRSEKAALSSLSGTKKCYCTSNEAFKGTKECKEMKLSLLSSNSAFRQRQTFVNFHPFENSLWTRQTCNPGHHGVLSPIFSQKGSHGRKPLSTCRPLRFSCDGGANVKTCKVRFDLSGITSENNMKSENPSENESNLQLNIKNKTKIVSNFRREILCDSKYEERLGNEDSMENRNRPPLIHSKNQDQIESGQKIFLKTSAGSFDCLPCSVASSLDNISLSISKKAEWRKDAFSSKKRKAFYLSAEVMNSESAENSNSDSQPFKLHPNRKYIEKKNLIIKLSRWASDIELHHANSVDSPTLKSQLDLEAYRPPEKKCVFIDTWLPFSPADENTYSTTYSAQISDRNDLFVCPSGLSKSPIVVKNIPISQLFTSRAESHLNEERLSRKMATDDDKEENYYDEYVEKAVNYNAESASNNIECLSETSDTATYGTVQTHLLPSSDCESDTYVTIVSEESSLSERKFSDFSENSSSPYNTPPDTSSGGFCTPPDIYLGVSNDVTIENSTNTIDAASFSPQNSFLENDLQNLAQCVCDYESPAILVSPKKNEKASCIMMFDSPKLEFYETNDSVENLNTFLLAEDDLRDQECFMSYLKGKMKVTENSTGFRYETENFQDSLFSKNRIVNLLDKKGRRNQPLSRQNSTEEYNFLDPHDSSLTLSEDMSSPSTTPDTSNKTIIFRSAPLTVSNTIDLDDDDDLPISDSEIQVNFNCFEEEILRMSDRGNANKKQEKEVECCRSEPCSPTISFWTDFPAFSVPRIQSSSFTDKLLVREKFDSTASNLPKISLSHSESEYHDSELCIPESHATHKFLESHSQDVDSFSRGPIINTDFD